MTATMMMRMTTTTPTPMSTSPTAKLQAPARALAAQTRLGHRGIPCRSKPCMAPAPCRAQHPHRLSAAMTASCESNNGRPQLFSVYAPPSDPQAYVDYLIKTESVLIFSYSWSQQCHRAKHILRSVLGNDRVAVVELDLLDNGCEIKDLINKKMVAEAAAASTTPSSLSPEPPSLWLSGHYIGGLGELEAMQESGSLAAFAADVETKWSA